jgi:hypothetical protein
MPCWTGRVTQSGAAPGEHVQVASRCIPCIAVARPQLFIDHYPAHATPSPFGQSSGDNVVGCVVGGGGSGLGFMV